MIQEGKILSNEIYKIEKQVSDYIDELSRSESDKLEIEHKAYQNGVIPPVLPRIIFVTISITASCSFAIRSPHFTILAFVHLYTNQNRS